MHVAQEIGLPDGKGGRVRTYRVRDVAEMLSLSPSTVREMCADGRLKAVKYPGRRGPTKLGDWHVFEASVCRLLGTDASSVRPSTRDVERRVARRAAGKLTGRGLRKLFK